jgi:hypothetical protein
VARLKPRLGPATPGHRPGGSRRYRVEGRQLPAHAHIFEWPQNEKLAIPGLREKPDRVYLLADGKALAVEQTDAGLVVQLPAAESSFIDAVLVIETQGKLAD